MAYKLGTQGFASKTNIYNVRYENKAPIELDNFGNRGKIPNRLDTLEPYPWPCTCQTTAWHSTPLLEVG